MSSFDRQLEVVSKPQIWLKGKPATITADKEQTDEKAKGKCLKCTKVRSV
jgi:hypothetical protein